MAARGGLINGSASVSITNGPKASRLRRVAIRGSRANCQPQRKAVNPVNRTGVVLASIRSALNFGPCRRILGRLLVASGGKAMGKKPSCMFMQFPLPLLWPQGRQFLAVESSARADYGVMNAYIIASDHPQQPAEANHKLGAARFTGHHEPRKVRRLREQAS